MENKEALIVIDMLNDFVLEGAPLEVPSTRTIIPELRREIEKAREENVPVIYVCDSHERDDREFRKMGWPAHAVKGTKGAEAIEDLKPLKGDRIIEKKTYSAIYNTKLVLD
jgi:nicotinamidase-related amidase